ncbi:hypothetical protein RJ640_003608 [Escallonia rubra]|uniref:Reverse transcriptase Ty1/copia-type domain-containing protein n=1 Tax=Escallonia rubra TaxID=112253 RepID=A0AA88RVE9_9ASTE|nr:hypothetical protein RJ640_003608 [Escallonia rubra]
MDPSNPYFVHHSDHPGHLLAPITLNGANYPSWSKSMIRALTAKKKIGFIAGFIEQPSENDQPKILSLFSLILRDNPYGPSILWHRMPSSATTQVNPPFTVPSSVTGTSFIAILIYVDDILLTTDDLQEIERLRKFLLKRFRMEDLGDLKYFWGIEFSRSKKDIFMSQRKYALDILQDLGLLGAHPDKFRTEQNLKLTPTYGTSSVAIWRSTHATTLSTPATLNPTTNLCISGKAPSSQCRAPFQIKRERERGGMVSMAKSMTMVSILMMLLLIPMVVAREVPSSDKDGDTTRFLPGVKPSQYFIWLHSSLHEV